MLLRIEGKETHHNGLSQRPGRIDISMAKREELFHSELPYKAEDLIDFDLMREDLEGETFRDMQYIVEVLQKEYYIKIEDGPCIFEKGNTAMITQDENGVVRYTSNNKKDYTFFYLSVGDILSIVWKCYQSEAINRIALMMNINCQEIKDIEDEKSFKLDHNKEILKNDILDYRYYQLRKIIGKTGLEVLRQLNDEARRNLWGYKYRVEAGFFFFASMRHLGNLINKVSSAVTSSVLILEALGFIKILEIKEIPEDVLTATEKIMKERQWHKMPNFYIINRFDESMLIRANGIAELLLKNGITSSKATRKKLTSAMKRMED